MNVPMAHTQRTGQNVQQLFGKLAADYTAQFAAKIATFTNLAV